jgi:hypothetical protein
MPRTRSLISSMKTLHLRTIFTRKPSAARITSLRRSSLAGCRSPRPPHRHAAPLPNHSPTHLQPLSGEPPAPSPLPNPWPPIDCQSSQPPIPRWSLAGRPAGRREPSPSCFWWVLASKPLQKRATSPTSSACCCSRRPQRRAAPSRPAAAGEVQLLSLLLVFLPKFPSFCC